MPSEPRKLLWYGERKQRLITGGLNRDCRSFRTKEGARDWCAFYGFEFVDAEAGEDPRASCRAGLAAGVRWPARAGSSHSLRRGCSPGGDGSTQGKPRGFGAQKHW